MKQINLRFNALKGSSYQPEKWLIPCSSAQSQDSDRERYHRKQDLYPKRSSSPWVKVFFILPDGNPSKENKMKKQVVRGFTILAAILFLSITVLEPSAHARAGGSRSSGGGGSRSYSRPAAPSSQPGPSRQQAAPAPVQQQGGGFMRSMAGGLAGGMLGSMLFSSFAGAGNGGGMSGGGGGGIGLFGILMLAGIGYLVYRYFNKTEG